jgi:hypothetical protein
MRHSKLRSGIRQGQSDSGTVGLAGAGVSELRSRSRAGDPDEALAVWTGEREAQVGDEGDEPAIAVLRAGRADGARKLDSGDAQAAAGVRIRERDGLRRRAAESNP